MLSKISAVQCKNTGKISAPALTIGSRATIYLNIPHTECKCKSSRNPAGVAGSREDVALSHRVTFPSNFSPLYLPEVPLLSSDAVFIGARPRCWRRRKEENDPRKHAKNNGRKVDDGHKRNIDIVDVCEQDGGALITGRSAVNSAGLADSG
ncbi:hypothetical protein HN011_011775 [Eciton burchellii]|nr:hypothetical protein HN011_011775 [Eciton burchellii]